MSRWGLDQSLERQFARVQRQLLRQRNQDADAEDNWWALYQNSTDQFSQLLAEAQAAPRKSKGFQADLLAKLDRLETVLLDAGRRGRSRTFGSNY